MSKVIDFIVLCADKAYRSRRESVLSMYNVNDCSSEELAQTGLDVKAAADQSISR
jgi:hypothetical protein